MACLWCRCVAERFARDRDLAPSIKGLTSSHNGTLRTEVATAPYLLPGNRTVICYNPSPRGIHGQSKGTGVHSLAVKGTANESSKRAEACRRGSRSSRETRRRKVIHRAEATRSAHDVGFCSEENQSRAEGTMGEAQLRSGRCTQTARLGSIEKEDGSRTESEMGEGQRKEELGTDITVELFKNSMCPQLCLSRSNTCQHLFQAQFIQFRQK